MDTLLLSRIQFGANISFHILFPTITIALGWMLLAFKLAWQRTGNEKWMEAYRFWVKVFALSFGMGVVSGITMSFQFGTNWPGFMEAVGNIAGPLLAYEVLTAFFLEAVFLGIMLFGASRVPVWMHTLATFLVAFGTTMSAFWILVLNSWMHTPVGFEMRDGVAHATDWVAIIFNPSMPYRLTHMLLASGLTVAFLIAGVSALRWLWGDRSDAVRATLRTGVFVGAALIPLQILAGDFHGLNTLEHQPQKVMAMEGHYESHPDGAPLYIFGLPNDEEQRLDAAIGIPKLSSFILKHEWDAPIDGLDTIPLDEQPPVGIVFWSFRIMVGLGFAMLGVGLWSLIARWRGKLYDWHWLHRAALVMGPAGFIAVIAGWITTEVGRQPYVIYNLLRTADAASPLDAPAVGASLIAFVVVYFAVFGTGTWYILRLMKKAPQAQETGVKRGDTGPIRTAGITPGPTQDPGNLSPESLSSIKYVEPTDIEATGKEPGK